MARRSASEASTLGTLVHDGWHAPLPFGINVLPSRQYGSRPDGDEFDTRPVRTFLPRRGVQVDESAWPASVPAMRADTMSQLYTYLEQNPGRKPERLHELSHGEGFLEILRTRVNETGFYLMDEPDAPLSFTASLGLVALLYDLVTAGSQMVVATHSPIVAALPGASLLELGPWGIRPATWEDLSLVIAWRQFMRDPRSFFLLLF
jgi:predicted ATPase